MSKPRILIITKKGRVERIISTTQDMDIHSVDLDTQDEGGDAEIRSDLSTPLSGEGDLLEIVSDTQFDAITEEYYQNSFC
jgi:hypothetical protein